MRNPTGYELLGPKMQNLEGQAQESLALVRQQQEEASE